MGGAHQSEFSTMLTPLRFKRTWLFEVPGRAAPQGSKQASHIKKPDGSLVWNKQTGEPAILLKESSAKGMKAWRALVSQVSREHAPPVPIHGAIAVGAIMRFRRPKTHYGSKGGEPYLRSREVYVTSKGVGDLEKLLRSTFDALAEAQWMTNDCLISRMLPVEKVYVDHYTGREGAHLLIAEIDEARVAGEVLGWPPTIDPPNTIPGGTTNG